MKPETSLQADIIVIGAGVLGTFHAYHAARRGYKTLLLERNQFPNDASIRNFGMVVQTIVEAGGDWAEFVRTSQEIYRRLQHELDISVEETGSLYVASTEIERCILEEFAHLQASAYSCCYLDADEALRRYPFLQKSYCRGALLFPDDLVIDPQQMLPRLIPHLVERGLFEYYPRTLVVAIESTGRGCLVRDAGGNVFTADRVFLCNGAEYRTLFPQYFANSRLQICKLQMMRTMAQPGLALHHPLLSGFSIRRYPAFRSCPSYALLEAQDMEQELHDYGIHLLFKQNTDSSITIGDSHEYFAYSEASVGEERTNWRIHEILLEQARLMLALPDWRIQHMWNGFYVRNPSGEIYTETLDGVIHIVTGIAGKGMSTAPGFAQHHIKQILG
ncbi:MAG TPA: TIGR03364 family FAD-dependent oxidoreductase [Ktedonobacteraceae bacterium]|nr:TIGR03364 family FAD-dependent oxidoreductase [Ktedonobacteraceae bacterium]